MVEAQHIVSTRKLVDSDAEQQVLEELLETAKPPMPAEPELDGLHYLLSTPFRYPPLRYGSRFGTRAERGLWYGAETLPAAFAETAYYRLLLLEGTTAELEPIRVDLSAFRARIATGAAYDLTRPPFDAHADEISSPVRYDASQRLGSDLRAAGAEVIRYRSARDPAGGANLALVTPRAFAVRRPSAPETWYSVTTRSGVELSKKDHFVHRVHTFPRELFEVEGRLPTPAV